MNWNDASDAAQDYGGRPYVGNVPHLAAHNKNFRTAIWTGSNLQMNSLKKLFDKLGIPY